MSLLISIVVPVYNSEKYLSRCLDSLINQIYRDIEIICVNDGSTDNSSVILKRYQQQDSRIRIVNQDNQGLSVARNTGLQEAKGSFVYFCDSDDFVSTNTIGVLVEYQQKNNLDLVEGHTVLYTPDEIEYVKNLSSEIIEKNDIYKFYLSKYKKINAWNKLIRKEILIENTIAFIPNQISEDAIWMYLKLLKHCQKIGYCENNTYYYVKTNSGTITQKHTKKHYNSFFDIANLMLADDLFCSNVLKFKSSIIGDYIFLTVKELIMNFEKDELFEKKVIVRNLILHNKKYIHYCLFKRKFFLFLFIILPESIVRMFFRK
ncbi:glycosyltransferase family 2 protein [Treponema sp.]|uniref:glycosyltransferase family 2 protein n=1 Tax=Treponema sp. TaxID=166 RepID=UPI00257B7061|nr:glycosyltransferase family 2 protein [Treponema sp.]